jgi:hypothetical protein
MLSGVTGGVFPPPPQASSNPDRKKLDTKARELNRITSSQSVRKNFAFAFCVCGKSPRGPELLLLEMRAEAAYGMARRRNAGNDLPIRGQAEIRYSRALLLARIMWKLKFRWIHGAKAGRTSRDSKGIVGKKSPGETRPRKRPSSPAWSVLRVCSRSLQCLRGEDSLDAKLITSIFHGISTDRQPGTRVRSDSHAVRMFTREHAGYAGGNRRRHRPEAL